MPLAHTNYQYTDSQDIPTCRVANRKRNSPGSFRIRGHPLGKEVPTSLLRATSRALFSLVVCFAFAARRLRRTTPLPLFRIAIVQLYLKGVAHEPHGHRRFVAT